MADKRPSKPAAAPRGTKDPATSAPSATAPVKTVKIVKDPTGNQAVVVRKPRIPAALIDLPADERSRVVAEAAYYLAEARGFAPGHETVDWQLAEQAIAQRYRFI